jgi:hypothetical protein
VVSGCVTWTTAACATQLVCENASPAGCVDPNWAEWPMPNGPVDVAAGAPNPMTYTANGDGTVTDNVTKLTWQEPLRTAASQTLNFSSAQAYCASLTLGGHGGWRLPSQIELLSLVDFGIASPAPMIDAAAFPNTPAGLTWSSTVYAGNTVYGVDFTSNPGVGADDVTVMHLVRCVR